MVDTAKVAEFREWLVNGAQPAESVHTLVSDCARRLIDLGVQIDAFVVNGFFIHPRLPGIRISWTPERGIVQRDFHRNYIHSQEFNATPLPLMVKDKRTLVYRFDGTDEDTTSTYKTVFPEMGYTGLVLLPLLNSDGTVTGCLELATRRSGGFTETDIDVFRVAQGPFARLNEYYTERFNKRITLATYLGRRTSRKILDGKIALGDGDRISAVILFADLCGFVSLSDTAASEHVLRVLNQFFAAIGDAVEEHDGEILKFIGDAVLVLFETDASQQSQRDAAERALACVQQARLRLATDPQSADVIFRAAFHLGEVFFGNVGTGERLDFTVIGPAVNLAARMLEGASRLGANDVCSRAFMESTEGVSGKSVNCTFKGVDGETEVFVLDRLA